MDIGKKQQIMVDWFRKTLDESKKPLEYPGIFDN